MIDRVKVIHSLIHSFIQKHKTLPLLCVYRVLGQVSCEVAQPKPNRPTEGQLFVNVELSPMASPAFEAGRLV